MNKLEEKYDVYSKFDLEKHKQTFINYFETIINPNGSIEYAVPSHCEIVIRKYMEKYNLTRQDIYNKWCDCFDLANELGIILCWSNQVYMCKNPTQEQLNILEILVKEGLTKYD